MKLIAPLNMEDDNRTLDLRGRQDRCLDDHRIAGEGDELSIDAADGVTVNNANVIAADIVASNGVIHVIDTVLLPPEE